MNASEAESLDFAAVAAHHEKKEVTCLKCGWVHFAIPLAYLDSQPEDHFDHAVIAKGKEIVFDPHPSRAGLAVEGYMVRSNSYRWIGLLVNRCGG